MSRYRNPTKSRIVPSVNADGRPFWHSELAPDGTQGAICYRKRGYKRKDGTRKPPCPEGWHHHGPYLPVGLLGDEWYWKEPRK